MKKILCSAVVVSLTTILFSCKKENLPASEIVSAQHAANQSEAFVSRTVPFILSNWFPLRLRQVNASLDNNFLFGSYALTSQLTNSNDVVVAYAKYPSSPSINSTMDSFSYKQLPAIIHAANSPAHIDFFMSTAAFNLYITNDDPTTMPNINDFTKYEYRYIKIPRADYQTMHVDWNNYPAVAAALNFPL